MKKRTNHVIPISLLRYWCIDSDVNRNNLALLIYHKNRETIVVDKANNCFMERGIYSDELESYYRDNTDPSYGIITDALKSYHTNNYVMDDTWQSDDMKLHVVSLFSRLISDAYQNKPKYIPPNGITKELKPIFNSEFAKSTHTIAPAIKLQYYKITSNNKSFILPDRLSGYNALLPLTNKIAVRLIPESYKLRPNCEICDTSIIRSINLHSARHSKMVFTSKSNELLKSIARNI